MMKKLMRSLFVLAAGTTGVLMFGVPAVYAATGHSTEYVTFAPDGSSLSAPSPYQATNWKIGDCEQGVGNVRLSRPNNRGEATLRWEYRLRTNKTDNADQWHGTWHFERSNGATVVTSPRLSGPQMPKSATGLWYVGAAEATVIVNPVEFPTIFQVGWYGSC